MEKLNQDCNCWGQSWIKKNWIVKLERKSIKEIPRIIWKDKQGWRNFYVKVAKVEESQISYLRFIRMRNLSKPIKKMMNFIHIYHVDSVFKNKSVLSIVQKKEYFFNWVWLKYEIW